MKTKNLFFMICSWVLIFNLGLSTNAEAKKTKPQAAKAQAHKKKPRASRAAHASAPKSKKPHKKLTKISFTQPANSANNEVSKNQNNNRVVYGCGTESCYLSSRNQFAPAEVVEQKERKPRTVEFRPEPVTQEL